MRTESEGLGMFHFILKNARLEMLVPSSYCFVPRPVKLHKMLLFSRSFLAIPPSTTKSC